MTDIEDSPNPWTPEEWLRILLAVRSDVLYLLKYDVSLGPKRGVAYARVLASLELLRAAAGDGTTDDDSE